MLSLFSVNMIFVSANAGIAFWEKRDRSFFEPAQVLQNVWQQTC